MLFFIKSNFRRGAIVKLLKDETRKMFSGTNSRIMIGRIEAFQKAKTGIESWGELLYGNGVPQVEREFASHASHALLESNIQGHPRAGEAGGQNGEGAQRCSKARMLPLSSSIHPALTWHHPEIHTKLRFEVTKK